MATYTYKIAPSASPDENGLFIVRGRWSSSGFRNNFPQITLANGDDIIIATIPDNCLILAGYYKVTTAEGGAATFDLGNAAGGTQYLSNGNANSAGNWTILTDPNFEADDFDESTAEIDVYMQQDTALTKNAVIDVMFVCMRNNDSMFGS